MTSQVEITIPTTTIVNDPKPHTAYNISLRLPLRSFSLQKRYSDFTALHGALTSQTGGQAPPFALPPKTYFTKSVSSPALVESRRVTLEAYLQGINSAEDSQWRSTSAWRTFLNLPSTGAATTAARADGGTAGAKSRANAITPTRITDPVVWLDQHRELKSTLHDARMHLTRRDQVETAQAQHEASTLAKKSLLRAGTMLIQLDEGLKSLASLAAKGGGRAGGGASTGTRLGDGELRRRRDLVNAATREKEGLEHLHSAMASKSARDRNAAGGGGGGATATGSALQRQAKAAMLGDQADADDHDSQPSSVQTTTTKNRRVLGAPRAKETEQTRVLDNTGVLQLQQQMMRDQDEDITVLARAVARQKELGVQIQEELATQDDMLELLDEDVMRVQGKVDVARKRVKKVS